MKKLSLVLIVVLLVSSLAGCTTKDAITPAGEEAGKYLRIAKDVALQTMDQSIATDRLSFEVISQTIEGLYTMDADGNIIPSIAESYELSEDGLVYTFKLREANWSNGEAVTAEDFVFSWRRLADPEVASEYSFIISVAGIKNGSAVRAGEMDKSELGVVALDSKTLEVTLEKPTPYFLSLTAFCSFFPLNEKFVTELGDQYALAPSNLLANGPFKMVEWNKGYGFKLDKNTDYYDADSIEIAGLDYRIIKDSQTAVLKYESEEMDIVKLSSELVGKYRTDPTYKPVEGGFVWYISINTYDEVFSNVNARKALQHAFNKSHITEKILNDGSVAADYFVAKGLATGPDGKDFRESAGTYAKYDPAMAADYWKKAKDELGIESTELEILFDDSETVKKMAEFIQYEIETNLEGVTVNLKSQPKKNRLALMRVNDFQLGITRWGPDYKDPLTFLEVFLTSANNTPKYSSDAYDKLVIAASSGEHAVDPTARWEDMKNAEILLLETDAAIAPIFQSGEVYLVKENINDLGMPSVGRGFKYKKVKITE